MENMNVLQNIKAIHVMLYLKDIKGLQDIKLLPVIKYLQDMKELQVIKGIHVMNSSLRSGTRLICVGRYDIATGNKSLSGNKTYPAKQHVV